MRKFKLVKKFPGSIIEKGDIVESDGLGQYVHEKTIAIFQEEDVLDYPEFWEEVKQPLFTTEDGVDKHTGDSCFAVTDDFQIVYTSLLREEEKGVKARRFDKLSNAKEYTERNKPMFSLSEIEDVVELVKYPYCMKVFKEQLKEKLCKLKWN